MHPLYGIAIAFIFGVLMAFGDLTSTGEKKEGYIKDIWSLYQLMKSMTELKNLQISSVLKRLMKYKGSMIM
ncbi:hypothetical protein FJZ31_20740 [Candidatus Poribacteria bacterium]|nr:hypothetical protein [Candidatus Poribacteria bacterium]